jgi:hypothetical protein
MKRICTAIALVMLSAIPTFAGDSDGEVYGEGVTLQETLSIAQLLAEPDQYTGKKVRVNGVITGVCRKRGCWMQVTNPETGEGIRVKVEDGVIVFPYSAMGQETSVEGVFEAIQLTPEQVAARQAREGQGTHNHAPGETCDKGVSAKTGCDAPVHDDRIFVIRGTGAIIYS